MTSVEARSGLLDVLHCATHCVTLHTLCTSYPLYIVEESIGTPDRTADNRALTWRMGQHDDQLACKWRIGCVLIIAAAEPWREIIGRL